MADDIVVSRRIYVKPEKIAPPRRTRSREAQRDRQTAEKITQDSNTVRFHKTLGPAVPSAPPDEFEEPRSRSPTRYPEVEQHTSHVDDFVDRPIPKAWKREGDLLDRILLIGLFVVTGIICALILYFRVKATLVSTSWSFHGSVEAMKPVIEGSWTLPAGATLLSEESRFYQKNTVVDYVNRVCAPETRTRTEYSHTDTSCGEQFSHYEEDQEAYSHTEENCYASGRCEEEDVYVKIPGKAVYVDHCVDTPQYRTVMYWEEVCRDIPVTHQEPENRVYYNYEIMRWGFDRTLVTSSGEVRHPDELLQPGERYGSAVWTYELHFSEPQITKQVDGKTYNAYKDQIGQVLVVP